MPRNKLRPAQPHSALLASGRGFALRPSQALQELGAEAEGPIVRVPRGAGTASYPVISDLHAGRMLVAWTETDEQSSRVMGVRGRLASP